MEWFNALKPREYGRALFGYIERHQCGLILCEVNAAEKRRWRNFRNLTALFSFLLPARPIPPDKFAYHEVILGERPQKMRFDVDLTRERYQALAISYPAFVGEKSLMEAGEAICHLLLEAIIACIQDLQERQLQLMTDILLTESHDVDKFSRHLILTTTSVASYEHARYLFNMITEQGMLAICVREGIIDHGIYGKLKSFRILGAVKKYGDQRRKVLTTTYSFQGQTYAYSPFYKDKGKANFELLRQTLIGEVLSCQEVSLVIPVRHFPEGELAEEVIQMAIKLMQEVFGEIYQFESSEGQALSFRRLQPSYCDVCQRVHHKMNSLVTVRGSRLVHYCGRSNGVGQLLSEDLPSQAASPAPSSLEGTSCFDNGRPAKLATGSKPTTQYVKPVDKLEVGLFQMIDAPLAVPLLQPLKQTTNKIEPLSLPVPALPLRPLTSQPLPAHLRLGYPSK